MLTTKKTFLLVRLRLKVILISHKEAPNNSVMKITEGLIEENCKLS